MTYILILAILGQGGMSGHSGVATAEFVGQQACEAAGVAASKKWYRAEWVCVPKGERP